MIDELIIDENYKGLKGYGCSYLYDGDIVFRGSIIVNVNLFVSGSIEVGGSIKAGKWIEARSIKAGKWIEARSIKAGEWIEMYGIRTRSLIIINGTITSPVWVMDTHIKIGCHLKTKKEWLEIDTEKKAEKLGDDGSMWANRKLIKSFCME
jgi:hypothetical protein